MSASEMVTTRLAKIQECLALLRPILALPRDDFADKPENFLRGERLFEMIAQSMIDVGSHVVAAEGYGKPESFGELADLLATKGIVRAELAAPLHGMFALRNILVHEYLIIDRRRFYDEVNEGMGEIEAFCQDIASWLSARPKPR